MNLYKTSIEQRSNFLTPLKGDTLFGHMCWAISFLKSKERLEELLRNYNETPFLIVSDSFAINYLPKPTMPMSYLNEDIDKKKENRKKIWLTLSDLKNGKYENSKSDIEVGNELKKDIVIKNAINYKSFTTDGDGFDPYSQTEISFSKQDIYFLIDESMFSLNELKDALSLVSEMGYGKRNSVGKGRFSFSEFLRVDFGFDSKTYMALSPFSPKNIKCKNLFYEPFTRFGKSGMSRAVTNPFKKPIILADRGAVIDFYDKKNLKYIGESINGISTYKDIVHQGYSIVIPIKEIK